MKTETTAFFARLALALCKSFILIIPESAGRLLSRKAGGALARFFKKEGAIISAQANFVLSKGYSLDAGELARRTFSHSGEAIFEALHLTRYLERKGDKFLRLQTEGQDTVDNLLRNKQGALALSAHLGCFELLAAFHAAYGVKISVIGRDSNYNFLGQILRSLRKGYGVETIWRDDSSATRQLLRALKDGHVIAALIDQDTALENCFVPFFSLPAAYPLSLIRLALKHDIPLVSSFIVRIAPGQHKVITQEFDFSKLTTRSEEAVLSEFSRRLEQLILLFPDQWLWWHRRWRRRSSIDYNLQPELLRSTAKYLEWLNSGAKD